MEKTTREIKRLRETLLVSYNEYLFGTVDSEYLSFTLISAAGTLADKLYITFNNAMKIAEQELLLIKKSKRGVR